MPASPDDDNPGNYAEADVSFPRRGDVGDSINVATSPRATEKDRSPNPSSHGSTPRPPRKRAAPLDFQSNYQPHRSRFHSVSSDGSDSKIEILHAETGDDSHRDAAVTEEEDDASPSPEPDRDNHGVSVVLAANTSDDGGSRPQLDTICLCTPAPKVPRPRNAFILFRQHYQAQVVAKNAGMSNPEISKVIGAMWQSQPDDIKESWKDLAMQEKARHRKQYPDYRYQPRRGGRGGGSELGAAAAGASDGPGGEGGRGDGDGEDPNRCPRCGGRYIATPRTPATPRFANPGSRRGRNSGSSFNAGGTGGRPWSAASQSRSLPTSLLLERQQQAALLSASQQRDTGRRPLPLLGPTRDDHAMSPPLASQHSYAPMRAGPAAPAPGGQQPSFHQGGLLHHYQHGSSLPPTPATASLPGQYTSGRRPAPQTPWIGNFPSPGQPPPLAQHGHQSRSFVGHYQTPYPSQPLSQQQQQQQYELSLRHPSSSSVPSSAAAADRSTRLPPPNSSLFLFSPPTGRMTSDGHIHSGSGSRLTSISRTSPPLPKTTNASLTLPPLQTLVFSAEREANITSGSVGVSAQNPAVAGTAPAAAAVGSERETAVSAVSAASSTTSNHLSGFDAFAVAGGSADSQASGVRAMIMSISYLDKLHVLQRTSLPLPPIVASSSSSGSARRRGPIIAIEGHNPTLIATIGRVVQEALEKSDECTVRTWCPRETLADIGGSGAKAAENSSVKGPNERGDPDPSAATESATTASAGASAGPSATTDIRRDNCDSAADTGEDYASLRPEHNVPKNRTDGGIGTDGDRHSTASGAPVPENTATVASEPMPPLPETLMPAYLQFILSWHGKAQEMQQYVTAAAGTAMKEEPAGSTGDSTTAPSLRRTSNSSSASSTASGSHRRKSPGGTTAIDVTAPPSPASFGHSPAAPVVAPAGAMDVDGGPGAAAATATAEDEDGCRVPIALVTGGYSLALSDQFAMTVPINDAFSPNDHWQWMANLWRGIPGPDLVVYGDVKPSVTGAPINTGVHDGIIVVHAPPPTDDKTKLADLNSWPMDRRTERRLAFEVMEWVRASNFNTSA